MDERPLVEGYIANFGISLDVLSFCLLNDFPFFNKLGFLGILGPPYRGIGATIRIDREMRPYVGFFFHNFLLFLSFNYFHPCTTVILCFFLHTFSFVTFAIILIYFSSLFLIVVFYSINLSLSCFRVYNLFFYSELIFLILWASSSFL